MGSASSNQRIRKSSGASQHVFQPARLEGTTSCRFQILPMRLLGGGGRGRQRRLPTPLRLAQAATALLTLLLSLADGPLPLVSSTSATAAITNTDSFPELSEVSEVEGEGSVHQQRALAIPKKFQPDRKTGDDGSKCWVFSHMPKSGGSTVRDLLRDKWGPSKCIKYGNPEWKYGKQHADRMLKGKYRIYAGSHAEALRRYGGERCQYFTLFRHPIPRVVSAYFYCKKAPIDPLCATSIMRAHTVDLLTFVQHWGNFGLRLMSLSLGTHSPDNVMDWAKSARQPVGASGWYLQRKFMEAHSTRHDMPDAALADMLGPVKDLVNSSFAAVGILENFDKTLLLYDRALQMPGEPWPQWFSKIGARNVDSEYKREEEAALELAWADPRFQYFLKLDLELYEHALKVHVEQLARYGLA